jgi:trehalose-6-phosphate synthase
MRAMRRRVREHDVARWAADFLATLGRVPVPGGAAPQPPAEGGIG